MSISGKTLVVSGASSGIGRAVAAALGRRGAAVVLIGRNEEALHETAQMIPDAKTWILPLDLRKHDDIMPAIKEVAKDCGRLYGLCHAAGTVETLQLSACKPEHAADMMNVNYVAGLELARAVCRRDLLEKEGGSILFISAIYSLIGKPGQITYSASKGAINAAARAMAIELASRNIRVNCLSPGMVRSAMTDEALAHLTADQIQSLEDSHPLGFGTPDDVAHAACFLLDPDSRWITGANLVADGGCSAH